MQTEEWVALRKQSLRTLAPLEVRSITPSVKDFTHAVSTQRRALAIIAELSRATPEEGELFTTAEPNVEELCALLEAASVSALAVGTDPILGKADPRWLRRAADAFSSPVIAKDLILGRDQVYQARLQGADAVLLTAAHLPAGELKVCLDVAASAHMAAPVEVASPKEIQLALSAGARVLVLSAFEGANLNLTKLDPLLPLIPRASVLLVRGPFANEADFSPLRGKVDGLWIAGPWLRLRDPAALGSLVAAAENG